MLLNLKNLTVSYGKVQVLHSIDLTVNEGEIVTIIGANGAGKSTTLMAISGLATINKGLIEFGGTELTKTPAHKIVKMGIAHVPEGRRVFGILTVMENLNLGGYVQKKDMESAKTLEWIYSLFPILEERSQQLAGTLSGGEQQMLAIARGLMARPTVMLLDEPSLGLAPIMINTIFETIRKINQAGVTIILVEQNARAALKLADRGYVMEVGQIVLSNQADLLLNDPDVQNAYLGGKH